MSRTTLRLCIVLPAAALVAVTVTAQTATTLQLASSIALKGPAGKRLDHVALDAKRDRLFVANQGNASLDVIDLKAGKLLKSLPGQDDISGVVYVPSLDRVFATLGTGSINAFDGDSFKPLKSLTLKGANDLRYDPRGTLIYAGAADKKLAVFDAKGLEPKAEIKLPSQAAALVTERDRPRLYVNTPNPRQVQVVDTAKRVVLKSYPVSEAGNYPLALDEASHRLFVGCRKEPKLLVLDTESGKEVASVVIPDDVDDLYFDAKQKRIYASCGAGFVVVIRQTDADHYAIQDKVPTAKMARTSLLDTDGGRLFVPIPRQAGKDGPEIRIYKVKP